MKAKYLSKTVIRKALDKILYTDNSVEAIEWWQSNNQNVWQDYSPKEKANELTVHFLVLRHKIENHASKMLALSKKDKDSMDYFLCYNHGTAAKKYLHGLDWVLNLASEDLKMDLILMHLMENDRLLHLIQQVQDHAFIQFSDIFDSVLYHVSYAMIKLVSEWIHLSLETRTHIVHLWLPFFLEKSNLHPGFKLRNLAGVEIVQCLLALFESLPFEKKLDILNVFLGEFGLEFPTKIYPEVRNVCLGIFEKRI